LVVDGAGVTLIVDVTAASGQVKGLDGQHVTISGKLRNKAWAGGNTRLLIADTITAAPIPEMNK
jgi:hypothetical protein